MQATRIHLLLAFCFFASFINSCKHQSEDVLYGLGTTNAIGTNGIDGLVDSTQFLKLNEIQVIASHNSYRMHTDQQIYERVQQLNSTGLLPGSLNPNGWDYTHPPIGQQLQDYSVRGLEYDIYYDPNGGQFYNRAGNVLVGKSTASNEPELQQPGFKMIHIPDLDFNSNALTFKDGLIALHNWSLQHPNHIPIFVNIETKEETPAAYINNALPFPVPGFVLAQSIPFDANAVAAMDNEIKSVFGNDLEKVFTPDQLRGNYPTLRDAALAKNWPLLKDARGKVMFIIEGPGSDDYLAAGSNLAGKACFVYTDNITDDYAAFIILNNPKGSLAKIGESVSKGFIVRSRSDSDTQEARVGDYSSREAAISSGAHIISTDYYKADPRAGTTGWTDYHVNFSEGVMYRTNPITAPNKIGWGLLKE
jgi:hypothetical protein